MARWGRWEDHLHQVLFTKPAEVVQEACQVLENHGCSVKKELTSELYYSSTLLPSCVPSTALYQLDSGTCTNYIDCFNLHHFFKNTFQTVGGTNSCIAHMYTLTPHSHNTHTNVVCLARPFLEACATALNQLGMFLSNHVARWVNCSEMLRPRGSSSVTNNCTLQFCD